MKEREIGVRTGPKNCVFGDEVAEADVLCSTDETWLRGGETWKSEGRWERWSRWDSSGRWC